MLKINRLPDNQDGPQWRIECWPIAWLVVLIASTIVIRWIVA
jgi:hypothetical protein